MNGIKKPHGTKKSLLPTFLSQKITCFLQRITKKMIVSVTLFVSVLLLCFVIIKNVIPSFSTQEVKQQSFVPLAIPTFDLFVYCKEISASVMPSMRSEVYQRCLQLESETYLSIRALWNQIANTAKKKCIKMIRPGDGNYFLLYDCLINEKDGENNKIRNYF
ncbi:hypothetical protein X471_00737 [Bartonella bacilliformis str. Heidi Mejia]|nr:hypothetical protein X471_00737 [Bartonella bacilliformis str. Heidi Mejia]KEG19342.1 hypothetical protein H707_00213 [Bartonella bacilliformis Hosp800-02]KEG21457.1 hypothetical protein H704_00224 [Bartonella bacilliformis Peru38]KEG23546.1 hypothetical protein H703_00213 [Bartonella bacilliformis Ver075]KEG24863.1 hypothetical protein H706_00223 [Bartonella bacilliformis CAR600-02]